MENTVVKLPHVLADASTATRHVFVRDLVVKALIGIHEHEKKAPQKLVINVDLSVTDTGPDHADEISNVVCYEKVVNAIKAIVESGHVNLVETLAEKIASGILENPHVHGARIRIEKPDAFVDAASVGIEIERARGMNA